MKHLVVSVAALACVSVAAQGNERPCSTADAYAAEIGTDSLQSWDAVYAFYRRFGHCYDGAIAEGTQDRVQLLWANRWETLPDMLRFTVKDAGFKALIWDAVQTEAFPQDTFVKVLRNARVKCPKGGREFCTAVKAAAKQRHAA